MDNDITWLNQQLNEHLPLILASSSPRRKSLLQELGLKFKVIPSHIEEKNIPGDPEKNARTWAFLKAQEVAMRHQGVIIGADTIVVLGGKIFGKPRDEAEARRMLYQLSGHTHRVITGMALINTQNEHTISEVVESRVTFRILSEKEIDAYIATKEPMDKAGAYGIQGQGAKFIRRVQGCYTNVVGLPISSCLKYLKQIVIGVLILAFFSL